MKLEVQDILTDMENHHVIFHKHLKKITGNTQSAIILTHAIRCWQVMGRSYFVKFREPCEHRLYTTGTSWCEELSMSRSEFNSGFNKISRRVREFSDPVPRNIFIKFYTDSARATYFALVVENLESALMEAGVKPFSLTNITQTVQADHKVKYENRTLNIRQAHNYFILLMQENGYPASNTMTSKEAGLFKGLIRALQGYSMTIQDYLHNAISQWNELRRKITWDGSNKSRLRERPSIEELSLSREAILSSLTAEETAAQNVKTITSINDIPSTHPAYKRLCDLFNAGVPIKLSH